MFRLGLNTYSIRALRWHDLQLLEYAAGMKLDAIFLQDSIDPGTNDPAHWKEVKEAAARLGLCLETGGGAVLPATAGGLRPQRETAARWREALGRDGVAAGAYAARERSRSPAAGSGGAAHGDHDPAAEHGAHARR